MSRFVQEVNGFDIVRSDYGQFDTGYAVLNQEGEQVAWFEDVASDEAGTDTALDQAVSWCNA